MTVAYENAIRVRDLTRKFGGQSAVDGLSFDVRQGELFGLAGPDGAGKTTTLRMLAGVLRPTRGDATLNGISVAADPEGVKHSIAYMSQRFGLYADLTVEENLGFYADMYQVPKVERANRLERLYEFSRLGPFRDRLTGQLSGGMKQKLGLSCALIHQPEILLLDEPTFGVDPVSRRDLWLIVHEMVAEGVTTVVSTSYMDEAERFDRVLLLDHGRAIASGTPSELQRLVEGEIIAIQIDRPGDAAERLAKHASVRRAAVFGDKVHVTLGDAAAVMPGILRDLTDSGFAVGRHERVEPSMEDVFIDRLAGRRVE